MTPSEAAKLSAQSRKAMEQKIDDYAKQFRPKVIRKYKENGYLVTVYEPATCCNCHQFIKPTGRSGDYEL